MAEGFVGAFEPASPAEVLHLCVVEAKDLIAADKGGTSDPFAIVTLLDGMGKQWHTSEKLKTAVVKKTLAPTWEAEKTFGKHASAEDLAASTLNIALFDHDRIATSHEPLGEVRELTRRQTQIAETTPSLTP